MRSEVLMSRGDVLREDGVAVDKHISLQDKRYDVKTCGVLEWRNHSVEWYRVLIDNVQNGRGAPFAWNAV